MADHSRQHTASTVAPPTAAALAIEAYALRKRYGDVCAVDGIDLAVPAGQILGVLGPNGAGKSTTLRMLTTMTRPTSGSARVAGHDVLTEPDLVRRAIGVTGQDASLDELLTGRHNLTMVGQLCKLERTAARRRAAELLERFSLTDAADRQVKTYSGGMRRRLDLAASIIAHPQVLFLDEPTTGLDPVSRQQMWGVIRELVADGTTLLLTTQYLDEADALADTIVVIDHGRIVAHGTAAELKRDLGAARIEVSLTDPHPDAARCLAAVSGDDVRVDDGGRLLVTSIESRRGAATDAIRALDAAGIAVDSIEVRQPSLDDVFFHLTSAPAPEAWS